MNHRPSMRPDFEVDLPTGGERVFELLKQRLQAEGAPFIGEVLKTHAYVRMPRENRSLLSPNLNLDLLEEGDRIRGRFTPHPSVWMGFMAVFCTLAMLGLCGLIYGLAQLTVDEAPWAMLAAPVSIALIAFVYGAAFIGQGLVADEMYRLRTFIDETIREAQSGD